MIFLKVNVTQITMDLYDDLDAKQRAGQIDGWSSGIKLLQTQLALKKATVPPTVKKELPKRPNVSDNTHTSKTSRALHKCH